MTSLVTARSRGVSPSDSGAQGRWIGRAAADDRDDGGMPVAVAGMVEKWLG
ncbi:MAG: hypothetical protein IPH03_13690 [Tetrasphaera sp.]|nr:hypothetical protein [Tetrasphaera sp.]